MNYGTEIAVVIRRTDGRVAGYQSSKGLITELSRVPEACLLTPKEINQPLDAVERFITKADTIQMEAKLNYGSVATKSQSGLVLSNCYLQPVESSDNIEYQMPKRYTSAVLGVNYMELDDKIKEPRPIRPHKQAALIKLLESY